MSSKGVSFSKGVVGGLQWMYLSSMLQGASKLIVLICLTRLLDPAHFGIMGIALIFTSFAERLGQIGVGAAVVQREHLSDDDITAASFLSLLSGLLIFFFLVLAAPTIADFFHAPPVVSVLRVLACIFIVDGFSIVSDSMLQRQLKFRDLVLADNVSYLVGNLLIGITFALLGFGVWALVFATLTTRVLRSFILLRLDPRPLFVFKCKWASAKMLLCTGVGYSLGRILSFMSIQGDNFVVGRVLGVAFLGMYSRGYQLMTLPAVYLGQVLERVLFPAMAKKQSDLPTLRNIFFGSVELVTLTSLPASVYMYFLAPEIVSVLFGQKWLDLIPVLQVLSIGVFFRTAYKCGDTLARSMGAPYALALRQLIYTLCIVIGSWLGAEAGGLQGVAVAVVIAVGVNYFLMARLSREFLQISWPAVFRAHYAGIWVSAILSVGLFLMLPALRTQLGSSIVVLFTASAVSGVLCVFAMAVAPSAVRPRAMVAAVMHLPLHRLGSVGTKIQWLLGVRSEHRKAQQPV